MIIWSTGGDLINLGGQQAKPCATCGQERQFSLLLQYRFFALYYLFGVVTQKKYLLLCNICSRGWEMDDAKALEAQLTKSPIPFMKRYGLLVLAGIIVFFILVMSATNA